MKDKYLELLNSAAFIKGYDLIIDSEIYPVLKKKDDERIMSVGVGNFEDMRVNSLGSHIIFTSIESIVQGVNEEWYKGVTPTVKQVVHSRITGHEFGQGIYNQLPLDINNADAVERAIQLLEKYMFQDAEPFFKYWNDITVFLPWLELDFNDFQGMNSVFLQEPILKKTIVWYLTNHPQYEDFVSHHEKRIRSIIEKEPKRKPAKEALKKFLSLKVELEKKTPLFSWDESYLTPKPFKGVFP